MKRAALISGCWIGCCANFVLADKPSFADAVIPGEISDGRPSPPVPLLVLPDFKVKSTVIREMEVVEPPPMAGLPPVTGTITTTVQVVEDPKLPDSPPPTVYAFDSAVDSPGDSGLVDTSVESGWSGFVFVSATVYDHSRTLVRCIRGGSESKEITFWSNLDFNHFIGFTSFAVESADGEQRNYDLPLISVVNEDTQSLAGIQSENESEYEVPTIPALPDDKPAYVIEGTVPDAVALKLVEDLHELYRCEGKRMKAAYQARIKAEAEQRAYYIAHPPVPKDVTIQVWKREVQTTSLQPGGDR